MLSARTIAPYAVSPPSVVRCPPRSRTLRQPSQTRSRLRSNGCVLRSVEGLRRRVFNEHVDELAGRRCPAEVHGRVATCPSAKERRVGARRPLDENLFDAADALLVAFARDTLHDFDEL